MQRRGRLASRQPACGAAAQVARQRTTRNDPINTVATAANMAAFLYGMMGSCILVTKSTRATLPSLLPLLCRAEGFGDAQQALLMSAFYPGYLLTQIPAGYFAQRFGAKLMLSANLVGTAGCFGFLPVAVRAAQQRGGGGMLLPAALLATMGLFQGALIPGEAAVHQTWLPKNAWRPFILQLMFLCHCATNFIATFSTPRIAAWAGSWTAVSTVYGLATACVAVLWQLFVSDQKKKKQSAPSHSSSGALSARAVVEWRIFRAPSALSVCLCQVADNNLFDTVYLWAPTYFHQVLGCQPTTIAGYLMLPQVISTVGGFGVAALETLLLQNDVLSQLNVRRSATALGAAVEAAAAMGYGRSKTAERAAIWLCVLAIGQLCHRAGFEQSYHEVGGKDSAILSSVGNCVSNGAGIWVPPCSLLLRRAFGGSWLPHLAIGAGCKLLSAAFYVLHVTLQPARRQFELHV